MKKLILLSFLLLTIWQVRAQEVSATDTRKQVLFETNKGNIRVALFDETPLHRDNMLKLVREQFYDGLLFHRVIYNFMIQTGDSASRHARPGQFLGEVDAGYTIPAEIRFPQLYHRRGMLGMARAADAVNPERESSGSQFYIVTGRTYMESEIKRVQARLDKQTGGAVQLTDIQKEAYGEIGRASCRERVSSPV